MFDKIEQNCLNVLLNYPIIIRVIIVNKLSERRKRLHDLLLTLINKDSEFQFIEEDSNDLTSSYSEKDTLHLSRVIEKNRKIIKRYQSIIRTAVTLDTLMDSENEENYKIK